MEVSRTARLMAESTPADVSHRIERQIAQHVEMGLRDPTCIEARLAELDREWDVERMFQVNASAASLVGIALGATVHRAWYTLAGCASALLLLQSVQGWSPPIAALRRMGFRTAREIETERHALKAMRGDYADVANADNPVAASLEAAMHTHDVPDAQHRPRRGETRWR